MAGLPVTTPDDAAREARYNAEKAKMIAAKFEERCKAEHKYGGAIPPEARSYEIYDAETKKNHVYKGQLNYQNQPHGYGRMEYSNGEIYEGELDCARCIGLGRFRGEDYTFTGEFSDSAFNGFGVKVYDDGDSYMGAFSDGIMKSGVHVSPTRGCRYEGEFGRGLVRNGYGKFYLKTDEYGFYFIQGYVVGTGYYKSKDSVFKGFYNSERKQGSGVIECDTGARYEGQVVDYLPGGYGRFTDAEGDSVICNFVKGKPEGIRIVTRKGGKPERY